MAHEVESLAYYGREPWHGLGTRVDKLMTAEEALSAAELDWRVDLWPLFTVPPDAEGTIEPIEVPSAYAVVRDRDRKPLGTVGGIFTPVQNVDGFSFLDELVSSKAAKYETAMSLRGGKIVVMLMRWHENMKIGDDEIASYLFCQNRHDGKGALIVADTNVRIVCANTLRMAIGDMKHTWYFRHATNIHEQVAQAREAMQLTIKSHKTFAETAQKLLTRKVSKQFVTKFAEKLYPTNAETTQLVKQNAEQRREQLLTILQTTDDLQSIKSTAWGVYNAVVVQADHARDFRSNEARMSSIMLEGGSAVKIKDRAVSLLLQ